MSPGNPFNITRSQSAKTYFRTYQVEGDRVAGVSLHSMKWPTSSYTSIAGTVCSSSFSNRCNSVSANRWTFQRVYICRYAMQGILVERLTSALWPTYLDYKTVVLRLLERLDVIVKQSARLSSSVIILSFCKKMLLLSFFFLFFFWPFRFHS